MRLAGGMAHHFNNMLTAMMGYASVARNELPADHPARRHIDEIEKIAIGAADLSHQLQTFGQRHQPHTETVELSELIETSKPMLQAILPPSITLRTELLDGLPSLNADPEQLRRLLVQLLYQASESIGADAGTVILRTQLFSGQPGLAFNQADCAELPAGEYVWLQVSDTGPGLDDEAKEHLFEPFPSGAEGSRGPGLATALGIVHGHRGAIVVSSKVGLARPGTSCCRRPPVRWRRPSLTFERGHGATFMSSLPPEPMEPVPPPGRSLTYGRGRDNRRRDSLFTA